MGLFTSDGPLDLQPVNPPLGVNLAFTSHPLVSLVLKEQVFTWSGDDFTVTDQAGMPVVTCSGKAMSLRQRKEIMAPNGEHLFTLREKMISLHRTFRGEDRNGNVLFEIKKRMSCEYLPTRTGIRTPTRQVSVAQLPDRKSLTIREYMR